MRMFIKPKKLAFAIGLIVTLGAGYAYIYNKVHTNTPDDIRDHTGKYLFNPDYKGFHKYQWTDFKTVYPTKLAYDPEWFKLPPDKYIPKEQPIPKQIEKIDDPAIRRNAYFNFLCRTEGVAYKKEGNSRYKSIDYKNEGGILELSNVMFVPKSKNPDKFMEIEAITNPFISPRYSDPTRKINTNDVYSFFYSNITKDPTWDYKQDGFVEVMSDKGDIYQIRFDKESSRFLPLKKMDKSEARFYKIERPIEREEMKNLGIYGVDSIIFDRQTNKLVHYYRQFDKGTLTGWMEPHDLTDFSWIKYDSCGIKAHLIENFE